MTSRSDLLSEKTIRVIFETEIHFLFGVVGVEMCASMRWVRLIYSQAQREQDE